MNNKPSQQFPFFCVCGNGIYCTNTKGTNWCTRNRLTSTTSTGTEPSQQQTEGEKCNICGKTLNPHDAAYGWHQCKSFKPSTPAPITDEELEREAREYADKFANISGGHAGDWTAAKAGYVAAVRKYRPEQGGEGKQDVINHQSKSLWEQGNRIKELKQRIAALEKQLAEDKWVSVSERLPENLGWCNDRVLFVDKKSRIREGCYDFEFGWCSESEDYIEEVTHWQPLPSPPQTNNK